MRELETCHPTEPHYLYALGRLHARRGDMTESRVLLEKYAERAAVWSDFVEKRDENFSLDRAMATRNPSMTMEATSHWQVNVEQQRKQLRERDDFANPATNIHTGEPSHSDAAISIYRLPPGGWHEADTRYMQSISKPTNRTLALRDAVPGPRSRPRQQATHPHLLNGVAAPRSAIATTAARNMRCSTP